jgi:SAM-dependent methyltransferase
MKEITLPRHLTWSRCLHLSRSEFTLLRSLQYECIRGLQLSGRWLDIGGGKTNSYHPLLSIHGKLESINIEPSTEPTFEWDLNNPLPFDDDSFDGIISLNTFEHVRNDGRAVHEAIRVLRRGRPFHFLVPFLHYVHSVPHDFNRRTAFWWRSHLLELRPSISHLRIEPLVWDTFSTACNIIDWGNDRRLRRQVMVNGLRQYKAASRAGHGDTFLRQVSTHALSYYISGIK